MFLKFLFGNHLTVRLCLVALCLAVLSSCQGRAGSDKDLLTKDKTAMAELQAINRDLQTQQLITPENFDKLKALRAKYPDSKDIEKTFVAALADREDWELIEELLTSKTSTGRDRDDNVLLAKVLVKRAKYAEGLDQLRQLGTADSNDVELRSISAFANFNLGKLNEAEGDLDAVWDAVIAQKRIAEINLKGMIQFRNGQYDQAVATFEKSLAFAPTDPATNNMMSRTYAAMGNAELADKYRLLGESSRDKSTLDETNKLRFVSLGKKLQAAWTAKRYSEVIDLAGQMLPLAAPANRVPILQYLAESHKALGNQAAADAAMLEIEKLKAK
ncbi:MAG: hypothetical protein WBO10_13595 [Pyrinomonadaceae bacterium]